MDSGALVREAVAVIGGDPKRAASLCREALAADPSNGDAQLMLSEALRLLGDLAGARADWFGAHRQLGVVLAELGEGGAAALALKRAAELNPRHATLWRELGDQA